MDFVAFVRYLLEQVYAKDRRVHLVMDNLNTHFRKCFVEVLGANTVIAEVDAWQQRRNTEHRDIEWNFTRQDADEKMSKYYVS